MGIEGFVVDGLTQDAQRRAADPRASAWVSANAGAGKTKVLTDRVVRLLLHGAAPAKILCLTFTKAAAANMAIRVFERLGRWVTLDEASLRAELTALEGEAPDGATLRRARRLFARAVETPAGSRSRPCTLCASACCTSCRSRRTCRPVSWCWTRPRPARRSTGRSTTFWPMRSIPVTPASRRRSPSSPPRRRARPCAGR